MGEEERGREDVRGRKGEGWALGSGKRSSRFKQVPQFLKPPGQF